MNITDLKYRLLQDLENVLTHLFPNGERQRNEYCVGSLSGEPGKSLKICLTGNKKGVWSDFSSGHECGDIVDLWRYSRGLSMVQTMDEIRDWLGLPQIERRQRQYKRPEFPPYKMAASSALRYLNSRRISQDTIDIFALAWDEYNIIFPSFRDNELLHWKKIAIERENGKKKIISSPGTEPCLFGWQAITEETRSIIICEGEIDALSFREYGLQALSLPFGGGKGDKQQWIENERPYLDRYDLILLAVDDDWEGYEAAREIVMRLGQHRCKLVKLPFKDCNECLVSGVTRDEILQSLQNATTVSIEQLRQMAPSKNEPPHSTELEQFVLCWLLNNDTDRHLIFSHLEVDDFYWPSHQMIFSAFCGLHQENAPLGIVSVIDRLTHLKVYGDVVSRAHLEDLRLLTPTDDIPHICSSLRAMATRRLLIQAGESITREAFLEQDVQIALSSAQRSILRVSDREASHNDFVSLANAMGPVIYEIEQAMNNPNGVSGLKTGFHRIDTMCRGFQNGQLIICAGRPGMGKTALLLNILHEAVVVQNKPSILFSMEMSDKELFYRLIAIQTGVSTTAMKSGTLSKEQFETITDWYCKVANAPLYVQDTMGMTPAKIRLCSERMKIRFGSLGLIAVDYLQLMEPDRSKKDLSTNDIVSDISKGLKRVAKDLNAPVFAAAQLSRGVEMRQDKRPVLSDLRDSGAIEQDADVVLMLYRDDYYNKKTPKPGIAEIIIAKQRDGPTGTSELLWDAQCTRFRNIVEAPYERLPPI